MAHLSGTDRLQLLFPPEAVDDYVGPDNPVRFIEAFVDELDLQAAGCVRVAVKATCRPTKRFDRCVLLSDWTEMLARRSDLRAFISCGAAYLEARKILKRNSNS